MKYIIMLFIISAGTVSLPAMPPHPDLVEKYRREGRSTELVRKMNVMNSRRRSVIISEKAYPASGEIRIPVVLVRYGTPYESASAAALINYNKNLLMKGGVSIIPGFALFFILLILLKNKRKLVPGISATFCVMFASMFISCGVDPSDGDDVDFSTDVNVYNRILNGDDTFTLSAKKYFSDMSNENLIIQFDFFGPVIVSKAWDYYGANDGSGNDLHPGELVGEALRLLVSKNASIDFSVYDNNSDGAIESVVVIHEGPGEETGAEEDTIWSHEYDLYSAQALGDGFGPVYTDGVKFNKYTVVPEYYTSPGDSTIGVFCHELGHALSLPDMYDTSNATDGAGLWSVMGAGAWGGSGSVFDGSRPAPLLAWERYRLGGADWVAITEVTSASAVTVNDIETSPRTAYKVNLKDPAGEQYYLVEGKTASGADDWYVPGSGILITHIHEGIITSYFNSNTINDGSAKVHGVTVVEADGDNALWAAGGDKGTSADLFVSGDTLDNASSPDTKYYTSENPASKTGVSSVSISGFSSSTVPMNVNIMP